MVVARKINTAQGILRAKSRVRFNFHESATTREYFEKLRSDFGVTCLDDWYHVSRKDIASKPGGHTLLKVFPHLGAALSKAYPEHTWVFAKFKYIPRNTWKDTNNLRQFFENCKTPLQIKHLEDWYNIPRSQVEPLSGTF